METRRINRDQRFSRGSLRLEIMLPVRRFQLLKDVDVVSLIHPSAVISSRASVGVGVFVAPMLL